MRDYLMTTFTHTSRSAWPTMTFFQRVAKRFWLGLTLTIGHDEVITCVNEVLS